MRRPGPLHARGRSFNRALDVPWLLFPYNAGKYLDRLISGNKFWYCPIPFDSFLLQRSAVTAVNNISQHVNSSNFRLAADIVPNLTNLMNSFDEKVGLYVYVRAYKFVPVQDRTFAWYFFLFKSVPLLDPDTCSFYSLFEDCMPWNLQLMLYLQ